MFSSVEVNVNVVQGTIAPREGATWSREEALQAAVDYLRAKRNLSKRFTDTGAAVPLAVRDLRPLHNGGNLYELTAVGDHGERYSVEFILHPAAE
jgi:hypothetical protein